MSLHYHWKLGILKCIEMLEITDMLPPFDAELTDERNEKMKELVRKKFLEYLDRAEKLKQHLAATQEAKGRAAIGANGGEKGVGGSANGKQE